MEKEMVLEKLKEMAVEFGHEIPDEHTKFVNCGVDSLEIVEMLMQAEKTFNISVPDMDVPEFLQELTLDQFAGFLSQYRPITTA